MNDVLKLTRRIGLSERGQLLEVPFLVPPHTAEIAVSVRTTQRDAVIDVGMRDSEAVRGWSGGTKYDIQIGRVHSTPGYWAGVLPSGEWAVILGAYHVPDTGTDVILEIRMTPQRYQWFKGDLHVHTIHSDGSYSLRELDDSAMAAGLDFLALTDHNTTTQNMQYPRDSPLTYLPAMELTTYRGHANLFGLPDTWREFRTGDASDVWPLISKAQEAGAWVSINHPFDQSCPSCAWQWGWKPEQFDGVEVWNGPWRPINAQAVEGWQGQLAAGRRITAVGGSDTHRPDALIRHGYPTTVIWAPSSTAQDILHALAAGHAFVMCCPNGPNLHIDSPSGMMGDTVADRETVTVHVAGDGSELDLIVYSEAGEVSRWLVKDSTEWTCTVPGLGHQFLRAELWEHGPAGAMLQALTNPVFFYHEALGAGGTGV